MAPIFILFYIFTEFFLSFRLFEYLLTRICIALKPMSWYFHGDMALFKIV